jgi:hypothetical protein
MSNPKFKVENYSNLGGINSKFSPHLTSPLEFLDIKNFDFQTPGELSQRWGTTQYMGQTMAGKITALSEFQRLDGTSMIITGSSGGLWHGATTGNFQGMSFTTMGATLVQQFGNTFVGNFKYVGWYGGGSLAFNSMGVFYKGSSLNYILSWDLDQQNSTYAYQYSIAPQLPGGNYASIQYLVNQAFIADGTKFVKFDGTTTTNVGLPFPITATMTYSYDTTGNTLAIGFGGTGAAVYYASYVNSRGFESEIFPIASVMGPMSGPTYMPANPSGIIAMTMVLNTPLSFGISSINVYSYCIQAAYSSSFSYQMVACDPQMWNYPYIKLANYAASGSTQTAIPLGTTVGNINQIFNNLGELANPYSTQYEPLGITLGLQNQSIYFKDD